MGLAGAPRGGEAPSAPDSGWIPHHLTLWEGSRLIAACPLYVKDHSQGEFVFDQGWASAAHRAGIPYYPKLLVAVPFTPVTGRRVLAQPDVQARATVVFAGALEELCERRFSSVHVNFCPEEESAALAARGWLRRTGYQYHWTNPGFRTFDDYLASLRSKRRNQARREQRELEAQGITIEALVGDAIPDALLAPAYRLYRSTVDSNPWGQRYLNRRVFELAFARWRSRLCLILARRGGDIVAGTVNVQKAGVLYGRYWGAFETLRYLHFNVCYYAAIEHCIVQGLHRFEPGAGGEFKHLRAFDAAETRSMHWIGACGPAACGGRVPRARARTRGGRDGVARRQHGAQARRVSNAAAAGLRVARRAPRPGLRAAPPARRRPGAG